MKKKYSTPTTKAIKVRISNHLLDTSVEVSNDVNNGAYDAKEDISFGW
ncbi:MAG: hypothetical protein Q4A15_04300 [Prevotellaceae bacterium]|nr:hypothetical protein [Prevotellaceae bacterium]